MAKKVKSGWKTAEKGKHLIGVKFISHNPRGGSPKTYYYEVGQDIHKGDEIRVVVPTGGNPKVLVVTEPNAVKQPILKEVIRDKRE